MKEHIIKFIEKEIEEFFEEEVDINQLKFEARSENFNEYDLMSAINTRELSEKISKAICKRILKFSISEGIDSSNISALLNLDEIMTCNNCKRKIGAFVNEYKKISDFNLLKLNQEIILIEDLI